MIEREIIADEFDATAAHLQRTATLLHLERFIADRSEKAVVDLVPMKDLAGIERHRQIEIRQRQFPVSFMKNLSLQINTD